MKRNIMILAAVVMLAALAIYQNNEKKEVAASHSEDAQPKRGFAAPAFELPALDDKNYAVGGQTEKLLLVNFWASWCGPCELEAPDLQELHESHGDVIALYGVNATSYDKERQARQFVDDFQLTFPILMDRDGVATSLYKVSQFPTTLLIDRNGVIRERITGVISKQEWERLIDKWAEI
ncbi:TlpA family protein disulfide reductase [Paenibacillus abyssi]|uniref:Thioredoxin n=1 Tax=Paenibacillus abyssi TaxID=1340531 RepID=A0A917FZL0_9BACL|nr:TlpA disulfide reductase family protein [Paenibacillus abyssi]GGG15348.1 thioredoxin [Paenibacillus abyssi]